MTCIMYRSKSKNRETMGFRYIRGTINEVYELVLEEMDGHRNVLLTISGFGCVFGWVCGCVRGRCV